ncbi:MAG: hypothetical protein HQK62_14575 [Desulfamplus sp.]|nr:hypothetical protein [Desulfamplus sp.]
MNIPREKIEYEVSWFNGEVHKFKDLLVTWLRELGHKVEISEEKLEKVEELSGPYKTKQYNLQIDGELNLSIRPFAIWLIGAKGRIDVSGPSGSEKFVFLTIGEPGIISEIKDSSGRVIEQSGRQFFKNVDETNWYWYDDSSYRKVSKLSKEIIEPLLERLQ